MIYKITKYFPVFFICLIVLSGCGGVNVKDYKDTKPRFVIEDFFQGKTVAKGVFMDRSGKIRREFTVYIDGSWDKENQTLTLDEDFEYKDGETDKRVWEIKKLGPHQYEGTAGDIVGKAEGQSYGNALNWQYLFDLQADGKTWRVRFNDWLYQIDETTVYNKAIVTFWGFKVGEVNLFFEKK